MTEKQESPKRGLKWHLMIEHEGYRISAVHLPAADLIELELVMPRGYATLTMKPEGFRMLATQMRAFVDEVA